MSRQIGMSDNGRKADGTNGSADRTVETRTVRIQGGAGMPASVPSVGRRIRSLIVLLVCSVGAVGCSRVVDIVDRDALDLTQQEINACAPYLEALGQSDEFFGRPIYALTMTVAAPLGTAEPADGTAPTAARGPQAAEDDPDAYVAYLTAQYDDDSTRAFYLFSDLQLDIQQMEQARLRLEQALSCLSQESTLLQRKRTANQVGAAEAEKKQEALRTDRLTALDLAHGIAGAMERRHGRFVRALEQVLPDRRADYRTLMAVLEAAEDRRSRLERERTGAPELGQRIAVALAEHWVGLQAFRKEMRDGASLAPDATLASLPTAR